MTDEERDLDAAERALGTLPPSPEDETDRRRRQAWERRLAPLLEDVASVPPPVGLFDRIVSRIDQDKVVVELAAMRRRVSRWQRITVITGAVAAALAIFLAVPLISPAPAPSYVAVVTADADGTPGLVVQFDVGSGVATVIPVGAVAPTGNSLELWHLPVGAERPRSLGLMPSDPEIRPTLVAGPGDLFAISLEPEGGSPSGQPTQPIYHGRVIQLK